MAASTTKAGSSKKRPSTAANRFYVVKTVNKARTRLSDKLDTANRKFIVRPVESGKTLVKDLKSDPRKTVDGIVDDGRAQITDLNKEVRTRIEGFKKDGRKFLTQARKAPRKALNGLVDDGKTFVDDLRIGTRDKMKEISIDFKIFREGVEGDARLIWSEAVDGGKKMFDKVPVKRRIETEVSNRVASIKTKFNLPSQKDIDRLSRQIKTLNTKVNKLSKAQAA
jgi:hypothetical protein